MTTLSITCSCSWDRLNPLESTCSSSWEDATPLDVECESSWDRLNPLDSTCSSTWEISTPLDKECELPWEISAPLDKECELPWEISTPLDRECELLWIITTPLDRECELPWLGLTPVDVVCEADNSSKPEESVGILLCELPWFAARSYIVIQQDVIFRRVSDSQAIKLLDCSVRTDINSFAWSISGRVASRDDIAYIRPASGPVETELVVNGYTWRFWIENTTDNYGYSSGGAYAFTGTSPSVELAKPYDVPVTKVYGLTQAQQIVNVELLGTGWAWDWEIMDWIIPADVFSVNELTKMEILSRIAKAVGGFVNTKGAFPDGTPYEERLVFKYKYPVSPKNWSGETPDHTIVDSILKQSVKWDPKPGYDHMYVSGKNAGVLVHVKRSGEPWTNAAPTIIDDLTLVQNVALQRGRNYLDATGHDQSIYTMDLTLPDSAVGIPGVLQPGDLCEVTDLFETWRGIVRGVRISVQRPGVTQTVELERHHV